MGAPSEQILQKPEKQTIQIDKDDLITQTVLMVQSLTQEEALQMAIEMAQNVDYSYFKLGGVLSTIQHKGWWKGTAESFNQFVENEYGFKYRKAAYLISIYAELVEADVAWNKVAKVGWSKLKEIASLLTKENVDEWVEKAMNMTLLQLQLHVAQYKAGTLKKSDTVPTKDTITSMAFKVHPDQKETIRAAVDKAKGEADTQYDAVALEAICLGYMAGSAAVKPPSLKSMIQKSSPEEVLEVFELVYPEYNVTVAKKD